jgi:hypothetical protein
MRSIMLSIFLFSSAWTADNVRLDVVAKDGTPLESFVAIGPGTVAVAEWEPIEKRKGCLAAGFSIPVDTWTEVGLTFTPSADAEVLLKLMGPFKPKPGSDNEYERIEVAYDQVAASGTKVSNGDFEDVDDSGAPRGWSLGEGVNVLTSGAKGGMRAVVAWHFGQCTQPLRVVAGKPVTVRVWARSAVDPGKE